MADRFWAHRLRSGEIELIPGRAPRWATRNPDGFITLATRAPMATAARFRGLCDSKGITIYTALLLYVQHCIKAGELL